MPKTTGKLGGIGVLVTRPAHQTQPLCDLIQEAGGEAIIFPTLEIDEPTDKNILLNAIKKLDEVDIVIFVSSNAVLQTAGLIKKQWGQFPAHLTIIAMGQGTANALKAENLRVDYLPDGDFSSEGLLSLPVLQDVMDKRIVIFRGEEGRELLYSELKKRGAKVKKVAAYRRVQPQADLSSLLPRWREGNVHVVISTSQESLKNLLAMAGSAGRLLLLRTPILVLSARMASSLKELGFVNEIIVAENASDEGIVSGLLAWKEKHHG